MSVTITNVADGIITVKISGKLTQHDLSAAEEKAGEILRTQRMRILIVAENFEGWDNAGDWGDGNFLRTHDMQMERLAIVGEERWKGMTYMFVGKGFRKCPIEYFKSEDLAKAQAWLMEKT